MIRYLTQGTRDERVSLILSALATGGSFSTDEGGMLILNYGDVRVYPKKTDIEFMIDTGKLKKVIIQ